MSLNLFKSNLIQYMQTEPASLDDFAEYLANSYDSAVKRGYDILNLVPLQTGNKDVMEHLLKTILKKNLSLKSGQTNIGDFGPAFQAYWMGAQGGLFPLPAIPAPGTMQNISINTHLIINPGQWSASVPTPPTLGYSWVDALILGITTHLSTVQGLIVTTSLYPTAPAPTPGPGIINWTGYTIPG